ncbi:MAG: DUF1080 domain-containing protein [Planctomycetaceae bacterium]|nr:DUF1080 domain-containing protein [Planctomycetaceae bacterium]
MMNRFLTLALFFVSVPFLTAAESNTLTEQEKAEGYVLLFDGSVLSPEYWGSGIDAYPVKDGMFYCKGGQLRTKKEYKDFVFRFQFKLMDGANNGVGIRAAEKGDPAYEGMEIQILDNFGLNYKNLQPGQYHGSIYQIVPSKRNAEKHDYLKPNGEWNEEEISAVGSHIKVVLNGETIVDADISKVELDEKTRKAHGGLHNPKGYICFLGHGSPVEFRNVRVKEIEK